MTSQSVTIVAYCEVEERRNADHTLTPGSGEACCDSCGHTFTMPPSVVLDLLNSSHADDAWDREGDLDDDRV